MTPEGSAAEAGMEGAMVTEAGLRERQLLLGRLAGARAHVLAAVDGLDEDQLRRPVLPSGWSALGMLRHLTISDERYWFATAMGGQPLDWPSGLGPDDPTPEWRVGEEESSADVLADYRRAIEESDRVIAGLSLDDPPRQPDDWWAASGQDFADLRAILLHVIVETATHAGHLDAARELIDGHQHLVV